MIYETALIWVLISAGYWGVFLLRRGVYPTATFPIMMMVAAALSGLGLLGGEGELRVLSLAGAIGLGAGACLLVLGPLARRLARRANTAERWTLARGLYEIADALQPGTGVREEKRLAAAFAEIHAGQVDDAIKALLVVRDRSPVPQQRAFDEHITMIYMTAWQWPEAIAHAEATILRSPSASYSTSTSSASSSEPLHDPNQLVRAVSAPLWVELIGAYGRVGNLERAAAMLEAFETGVADETRAAPLLHRARLVFLAMCGQIAAVRALAAPACSPHMTRAARRYWIGVAADRAGDKTLAAAELRLAISRSRGRARRMAEAALAASEGATKVELSPEVAAAARLAAERPAPTLVRAPRPWLTALGCGLCVAAAAALSIAGSSTEISTLVRAGAMVRGLISEGQWWRLATSIFVHVGAVHVAVNVISLWVIGRLSEEVFGKLRTAMLFAASGVVGATASYLASPVGMSAGASGAIFGLLGATLGELTFHRRHFAAAIRNGMWGALLVVAIATLVVGSQLPEIDQWAHAAGLASGFALGQLVSPRQRIGRRAAVLAWPVIAAFVALLAWGAAGIARADFATLMMGGPRATAAVGGLLVEAPRRWQLVEGELVDPDIFVVLSARVVDLAPSAMTSTDEAAAPSTAPSPAAAVAPPTASSAVPAIPPGVSPQAALDAWFHGEPTRARERNFATAKLAATAQLSLPPPWQTRELELSATDPLAGDQHYRLISFGRLDGDRLIVGSLYAPQSLMTVAAAQFAQVLASFHFDPSAPSVAPAR